MHDGYRAKFWRGPANARQLHLARYRTVRGCARNRELPYGSGRDHHGRPADVCQLGPGDGHANAARQIRTADGLEEHTPMTVNRRPKLHAENMNMVAIGTVVLTSREHIIALEPLDKGLMGTLLRYPCEVRMRKSTSTWSRM